MEFLEILAESFTTLTVNKLRTALATLGIVIGIGSVIALISLGEAGQQSVQSQIQSLGSNLLTVMPGSQSSNGVRTAAGSTTTLTYDDAKAIAQSAQITAVKTVSPELSRRAQIATGNNNSNSQVMGVTSSYKEVRNIELESGLFISETDNISLSKVAVLGPQVASDLFGQENPIGKNIRINKNSFRIIGITKSKGGSGFQNQDDMVFIPLLTAQKQVFGADSISTISIEAKSQETMTDAQNQVGYFLLSRHKLSDPTKADFTILSQADILGAASQITGTFTALLSGIAAISLLVGGIGIMNIMLVTVTERIREIGLRKALGAKKRTIITQFLVEAIMLTIMGGIFGMILGITISFIVSSLIHLPFVLSWSSVVLAITVSGGIGILFGWYPARRAANYSPIEALRYE
ncbi:FtsX-like permease family protein [Candidatus Microgenomates bacterium]|nr:MAG: FtsX-like permease family protein [Candidatus Microgenomates bacterium]